MQGGEQMGCADMPRVDTPTRAYLPGIHRVDEYAGLVFAPVARRASDGAADQLRGNLEDEPIAQPEGCEDCRQHAVVLVGQHETDQQAHGDGRRAIVPQRRGAHKQCHRLGR
jgi:hypothetical protein